MKILIIVGGLLLSGCVSPRWQVSQAEYSFSNRGHKADDFLAKNTVLVDTQTGKTWLMIPSDIKGAPGYSWVEMPEKR